MSPLLRVENLRVSLATQGGELQAVRGVDLSVERGETLCLVGESGCGKSMTALSLMRLLPRTARVSADALEIGGMDLRTMSEKALSAVRGNRVSMIFQEPMTALNPTFTIGDQLGAVYRRHTGEGAQAAEKRAMELLEKVGMTNAHLRLKQHPHQLSGGLRQRVLIAMALMCGPELIICDEPTTALDVTTQAQILKLLADLQRESRMGMIFITHDLGVVSRIADRIAVMYAGRIVETGSAADVLRRPAHPYTAGLLASVPRPGVGSPGTRLGTIPGTVPSFFADDPLCPFRDRCTVDDDACGRIPPPSATVGCDGRIDTPPHCVACHHPATPALAEARR